MRLAGRKNGLPNQPVASELVAASDGAIHVRWYRTHGEQFHTKLAMVYGPERFWLTVGSANLTRRNLADYNLEANLAIELPRSARTRAADGGVLRDFVEQPGVTGNRVHRGLRLLRRPLPAALLALPGNGRDWRLHLLSCLNRLGGMRSDLRQRVVGRVLKRGNNIAEPIGGSSCRPLGHKLAITSRPARLPTVQSNTT